MASRRAELRPTEEYTVGAIEAVLGRELQQDWGRRTQRDGRDGSGLTVDLTYDAAAIALELTSLQDPAFTASGSEAAKLEARLTETARAQGWGGWLLRVRLPASLKAIEPAVERLMAENREIDPMNYSSQDLMDAQSRGDVAAFLAEHRELYRLGISRLARRPTRDSVVVFLAGGGFLIEGFRDALQEVVDRKSQTLRKARPRETHLGVLVVRWDVSDVPSETDPPDLTDDVDVLWVVHPERGSARARVWMARRGVTHWTLYTVAE